MSAQKSPVAGGAFRMTDTHDPPVVLCDRLDAHGEDCPASQPEAFQVL